MSLTPVKKISGWTPDKSQNRSPNGIHKLGSTNSTMLYIWCNFECTIHFELISNNNALALKRFTAYHQKNAAKIRPS